MKPQKFHRLRERNRNFHALSNYRNTVKDITRYPQSTPFYPNTPLAFIHDSIMFMTPAQILDLFANSDELHTVYASVVVPPEAYFDVPSLYPKLYDYRRQGDDLVYSLEGNPSSQYTLPMLSLQWLQLRRIIGPHFTLSVTVLESWFSVHSDVITRGDLPSVPSVEFATPPAVATEVYYAIFNYVRFASPIPQALCAHNAASQSKIGSPTLPGTSSPTSHSIPAPPAPGIIMAFSLVSLTTSATHSTRTRYFSPLSRVSFCFH